MTADLQAKSAAPANRFKLPRSCPLRRWLHRGSPAPWAEQILKGVPEGRSNSITPARAPCGPRVVPSFGLEKPCGIHLPPSEEPRVQRVPPSLQIAIMKVQPQPFGRTSDACFLERRPDRPELERARGGAIETPSQPRALGLDILGQGLIIPEPARAGFTQSGRTVWSPWRPVWPPPRIWASYGAGVFSMDRPWPSVSGGRP